MGIERSNRPIAARRISAAARRLLEASPLCAIATVAPAGQAHVNTAYFAWSPELDLVWLSEPSATHSRNVRANGSAAIAVYESGQTWGRGDRGIQVFGTASELERGAAASAEVLYAARFPEYSAAELAAYRFYLLRPERVKLFDEHEFGAGVFVTARSAEDRRFRWEGTEIYRAGR